MSSIWSLIVAVISASVGTTDPVLDWLRISMFASPVPGADRSKAMLSRPTIHRHFLGIGPSGQRDHPNGHGMRDKAGG
jgi:hypothetical protein